MIALIPQMPVQDPGVLVLKLPASMRPAGMPLRYEVRLYTGERKILKSRRGARCSQWAAAHRMVTMSSRPGKWENETTPYLTGVMDASWFPSVRVIICSKTPQVGLSECVNNCIGYSIDCDPAPTLYVYPDENTARHNSTSRIQPMITDTPRLHEYATGYQDDMATLEVKLQHMSIYFAWASSTAGLANKPIRNLVLDEIDKYPPAGKKEADPISLAEARTTTYRTEKKIWKISTPSVESGPIWRSLMGTAKLGEKPNGEAQVVFRYWVCCPLCGCLQLMRFGESGEDAKPGGIKWPADERNAETVENGQLAWYECEHCLGHWSDALRDKAVRMGEWRSSSGQELMVYLKAHHPKKIGFHIPSWISPFVSLSQVASAFLKGQKDKMDLRNFMNSFKAEPWVNFREERTEDRIKALRETEGARPEGIVPSGGRIAGITASADTQDNGWWYEIRAWGYGVEQGILAGARRVCDHP